MGTEMVAFLESLSGLDCLDCLAEKGENPKVSGRAVSTSVDVTCAAALLVKVGLRSQNESLAPDRQPLSPIAGLMILHCAQIVVTQLPEPPRVTS